MRKKKKFLRTLAGSMATLLIFFSSPSLFALAAHKTDTFGTVALTKENIVDIVKPSVVRLGQHTKGTIILEDFFVDFRTREFEPRPEDKKLEIEIDEYITGSGFFVNSDGYIATNAHIASRESIIDEILSNIVFSVWMGNLYAYSEKEVDVIIETEDGVYRNFLKSIYDNLRTNGTFDLESSTVVIDPSSQDTDIKTAIDNGIVSEVVYANDNFFTDEDDIDDIAIIKIDGSGYPALTLSQKESLTVGEDIYALGFPDNARFGDGDFLESTFTSGSIGGQRDLGGSKVWQVDAKVSGGSSGGPLLNKNGEVVGIISFETDTSNGGDNFAFAVPLSVVMGAIEKTGISAGEGVWGTSLREGIQLLSQKHCKAANEQFERGRNSTAFVTLDQYINPYVEQCNALIASGLSIDTGLDEFVEWLRAIDMVVWMIIAGGVFSVVIFVVIIVFLKSRLRHEEDELENLEDLVVRQRYESQLAGSDSTPDNRPTGEPTPALEVSFQEHSPSAVAQETEAMSAEPPVTEPTTDPALVQYIVDARVAHMSDDDIRKALQDAGWMLDDIARAL